MPESANGAVRHGPRRPSRVGLAARSLAAGVAAAATFALADTLSTLGHAGFADALFVGLAVFGAQLAVVGLAAPLAFAHALLWARGGRGTRRGLVAIALAFFAAPIVALNLTFALAHPVLVWGGLAGLMGGFLVLGDLHAQFPKSAAAAWMTMGVVALVANATIYVGTNADQHAALALIAWAAFLPGFFTFAAPVQSRLGEERRAGFALALLVLAGAASVFRTDSWAHDDIATRVALRVQAPASAATFRALDPVLDADGDGWPGGFGGGDCAAFDASIAPTATDRPGDGTDQNCLGGDVERNELVALAQTLSAGHSTHEGPAHERILLVTIDALRFDADLPRTRAVFEGRCVEYEAWALAPATTYSMHGMFTSRFAGQGRYTALGRWTVPVDDPAPRLAEVFEEAGWPTAAFAFHHRFDPRMGITKGFGEVWTATPRPGVINGLAAPSTLPRASAWWTEQPGPRFMWVHLYDPHAPYLAHGPGGGELGPRARYESEVAFTDALLAGFLTELEGFDDTAVLVTGDHGEAFGEHGRQLHGSSLHEEQVRVPLWVCPPAGAASAQASAPVSALDVGPTLLDWSNLERPGSFLGRSLLVPGSAPIFAETAGRETPPVAAVREADHKAMWFLTAGAFTSTDLSADPGERGTSPLEAARAEELASRLDAWRAWITP